MGLGFRRNRYDNCFYFDLDKNLPIYLLLYVDDMLLISRSKSRIQDLKKKLSSEFDMKDLGNAKKILGMVISRDRRNNCLKLEQSAYLHKLVNKFSMADSKSVSMPLANHFMLSKDQCPKTEAEMIKMNDIPYSNVIGFIMYAMISTRPDLSFAISLLSRFTSNPDSEHWTALKWVLRYINNSLNVGLKYYKNNTMLDLVGFVDSDFAGDKDTRKSTTTYYFTLGGNCICWKSQLQPIIALSSTEAGYIAIADVFKEAVWL
ncbi:secreted RxLR effector protein 161-like [Pistacia vera]|uniref:secreted RxLR effector protein 161-like n=1 Tax=Pistacia vera TaxID=55513 RepID=UPI001263C28D|nr:secreted RxLR effector protein 161-like [Pistacia vera]